MSTSMLSICVEHAIHVECTLVYILHNCSLSGGPFIQGIKMEGVGNVTI